MSFISRCVCTWMRACVRAWCRSSASLVVVVRAAMVLLLKDSPLHFSNEGPVWP